MKTYVKTASHYIALVLMTWTISPLLLASEPFSITDEFLGYLKATTNPDNFGLKSDGRFYPYSTPKGRMIGYAQPVTDTTLFRRGWTLAEAEQQLRASANLAADEVREYVAQIYADRSFDTLGRKRQEILVDYALSEGVKNIKPEFLDSVIREDWKAIYESFMYVRWVEKGWPDNTRNKAFTDRWLEAEARLRPVVAGGAAIDDDFLSYLKRAANPARHGLHADGRFYPYASPQGRRIGYRQPISDKRLYATGWSVAEADRAVLEELEMVADALRTRVREVGREYDQLPSSSREILLDFGFTEGVSQLKPTFIRTVVERNWKRILDPSFYARYEADWPDSVRNKAFYERWVGEGGGK